MKNLFICFSITALFFISCNESGNSVFTVQQDEVTSTANGTMPIYVDQSGEPLHFSGHLKLLEGSCALKLYAPVADTIYHMDTIFALDESMLPDTVWIVDSIFVDEIEYLRALVYEENFEAPADVNFNRYFDRILGVWEFTYAITPIENVQPFGDFEFTFKYSN